MDLQSAAQGRGEWRSRLGFVFAAAGSAIGLGNIWRFPAEAARNGGGAFLLIYLFCVAVVGVPVMIAELSIGRHTRLNPVGAFARIRPGTPWFLLGGLGVVTGVAILSFYSVVAGWTVGYLVKALGGGLTAASDAASSTRLFETSVGNGWWNLLLHTLFMVLTTIIVVRGIKKGIETAARVMMPILLVLLLGLVAVSISLPGASEGLSFYLRPDWSDVNASVVVAALGQAFFSLSLGMGAMITYGSYLSRKENLLSSAGIVAGMDTGIAVLAGLAIFPAFAAAGADLESVEGGAGLIFVVLPTIFSSIPGQPWGGIIFGGTFFILLSVAALTSTISLLEVGTSWAVDQRGWSRGRAALTLAGASFVLGIPAALSNGAWNLFSGSHWFGTDFMSFMSFVFVTWSLTIGALFISLFAGWVWKARNACAELQDGYSGPPAAIAGWSFLIRYVCPVAILVILAFLYFKPGVIAT